MPVKTTQIYQKFSLTEQKPLENIKILVRQCNIFYWPFVYKPGESPMIHSITGNPRNCADLISLESYRDGKSRETKRILLIVNDGLFKDGLPKVTGDYFDNTVFMRSVTKNTSTIDKTSVLPGNH